MLTKNKVIIRKRDFMNNKAILMFCDLEGTLLNEKNGTLDARKLFRFFDQINNCLLYTSDAADE